MPNQYSQDDDGLQHALGVQQELDEIIASPEKIVEHLNRTQALMSESGGDFDAAVLRAAMAFIEQGALADAVNKRTTFALVDAIKGLLSICEAVRMSVGFGKNQLARIESAKHAIAAYAYPPTSNRSEEENERDGTRVV